MLTELPFPKGLTGSVEIPRRVSPSKETAGRNGVGGQGGKRRQDSEQEEDIQGKTELSKGI